SSFGGSRGNEERRGNLVELPDIASARIFELLRGDRTHGHRHVGERLVTASRGDDDVAGVDRLLFASLILRRSAFSCTRGRLSRCLVSVGVGYCGLSNCRRCNRDKRCRKQPLRLAHVSLPCWSLGSSRGKLSRNQGEWKAIASAYRLKARILKQFGNSNVSKTGAQA